ncbi:PP2C-domain-containing protein [Gonapodya prolifera JEL478]|uniref:protein-serine/threonine phosphatase n=1 Tax=Gonapodya prolifera (strain JEL478) TaxID=1344416 RepID=A0A139AZC1_GONPJ|nr:PP2C-domain-containing protein [Gonapodya prolifera JEL478]|eukprot:KXS21903.1 PP2C-domain-containing protein [Gonapodya prolifera JEL478]
MGNKHSKTKKKVSRSHSTAGRKAKTMASSHEVNEQQHPPTVPKQPLEVQVVQVSSLAEEYAAYGLPNRKKEIHVGADTELSFVTGAMQGWRDTMEDAHVALLKLPIPAELSAISAKPFAFFAVYDGHGGDAVSQYAGQVLHRRLVARPEFSFLDYPAALRTTFWALDAEMRKDPYLGTGGAGCTAIAVLITPDGDIFVGNAGDCRAVISVGGTAVALSTDHKPTVPAEAERILKSGGRIEDDRVEGDLAVSRALGDFEYKPNPDDPLVSPEPDVVHHRVTSDVEFLIMACDGIWDCLRSQEAVDFVRQQVAKGANLSETAERLLDHCLAVEPNEMGIGCDNMSVIIVAMLSGKDYSSWATAIKERVSSTTDGDSTVVATTVASGSPASASSGGSPGRTGEKQSPESPGGDGSTPEGGYAATAYSIRRGYGRRGQDAQPVMAKGVEEMMAGMDGDKSGEQ